MMTDNEFVAVACWTSLVLGFGMGIGLADWSELISSEPGAVVGLYALMFFLLGVGGLVTWWITQGALKRELDWKNATQE